MIVVEDKSIPVRTIRTIIVIEPIELNTTPVQNLERENFAFGSLLLKLLRIIKIGPTNAQTKITPTNIKLIVVLFIYLSILFIRFLEIRIFRWRYLLGVVGRSKDRIHHDVTETLRRDLRRGGSLTVGDFKICVGGGAHASFT